MTKLARWMATHQTAAVIYRCICGDRSARASSKLDPEYQPDWCRRWQPHWCCCWILHGQKGHMTNKDLPAAEMGMEILMRKQMHTVHFNKQLVEGVFLLALVARARPASLPAHRIDLIDKKDAGGIFTSHGKHIPYLIKEILDRGQQCYYLNIRTKENMYHLLHLHPQNLSNRISMRSSVLTLAGPTPTYTSWNSEPLTVMKGTLASPAVALASNVLPVPGGPERTAPWQKGCYDQDRCLGLNERIPSRLSAYSYWRTFGILAPRLWYCWGFFKKLTNSRISTLASSQPATSLNRTPVLFFIILALDSLMLKGFLDPLPRGPPINGPRRVASMINPTSINMGRMLKKRVLRGKRNISHQHQ